MNLYLILKILRGTLEGPISASLLSEEMPTKTVEQDIPELLRNGLVTKVGDAFETSERQKLSLAILAIKEGSDVERVCKVLGWREFEDFVAFALNQNGFKVEKHFRFNGVGRRYEIDVVGLKEPLVLSIECKHWRINWRRAAIVDAVRMQVERTRALAQSLPEPKDRLRLARWREVRFIPMVLTLSDTPLKIFEKVPIVPIFYFNGFLDEMRSCMDELAAFSMTKTTRMALT